MPLTLGIDLGTTTVTTLALDASSGTVAALATRPNTANVTPAGRLALGHSEWDASAIAHVAFETLKAISQELGPQAREVVALGVTGQQHGVVLVGRDHRPLSPLINWQDRRADAPRTGTPHSHVAEARRRVGEAAPARAGCRLSAGYLAVTLFCLEHAGLLPVEATACFLADYFAAHLAGQPPVTDPTHAASGGVFDVARGCWDEEAITALGLPPGLFPPLRPSGHRLGSLRPDLAHEAGLPEGVAVFSAIGDNQASFLGSVADRTASVLVNVGTGGQVAAHAPRFAYDPRLETRPFLDGGFLLVCAGLTGGRAYAVVEGFFRQVAREVLGVEPTTPLYATLNALAEQAPPGADGLRCEPFFSGTRPDPQRRGVWSGVSAENLTPGNVVRSLMEGMASAFRDGLDAIDRLAPGDRPHLVGAGNGLRENAMLARLVGQSFGRDLQTPAHREEAAFGAALLAAVSAGLFRDLDEAGRLIRYNRSVS